MDYCNRNNRRRGLEKTDFGMQVSWILHTCSQISIPLSVYAVLIENVSIIFNGKCIMRNENRDLEELVHTCSVVTFPAINSNKFTINASTLNMYTPNSTVVSQLGK